MALSFGLIIMLVPAILVAAQEILEPDPNWTKWTLVIVFSSLAFSCLCCICICCRSAYFRRRTAGKSGANALVCKEQMQSTLDHGDKQDSYPVSFVEAILDERKGQHGKEFLVKWNCFDSDTTWVSETQVTDRNILAAWQGQGHSEAALAIEAVDTDLRESGLVASSASTSIIEASSSSLEKAQGCDAVLMASELTSSGLSPSTLVDPEPPAAAAVSSFSAFRNTLRSGRSSFSPAPRVVEATMSSTAPSAQLV
jgi:hypothetical protein